LNKKLHLFSFKI